MICETDKFIGKLESCDVKLHVPVRTCIGCHERLAQSELVRLNLRNGEIAIVFSSGLSRGRSIYICPHEKCFDAAFRRGAIAFSRNKHNRIFVKMNDTALFIFKNKFMAHVKSRWESETRG